MQTSKLHAGTVFPDLAVRNLHGDLVDISKPSEGADWQMVIVYRGQHCPLCTKSPQTAANNWRATSRDSKPASRFTMD